MDIARASVDLSGWGLRTVPVSSISRGRPEMRHRRALSAIRPTGSPAPARHAFGFVSRPRNRMVVLLVPENEKKRAVCAGDHPLGRGPGPGIFAALPVAGAPCPPSAFVSAWPVILLWPVNALLAA